MTPFDNPDGSKNKLNYYTNPSVVGSCLIICNGAVLVAKLDQKQFSRNVPTCSDDSPSKLCTRNRNFANHALSCGYYYVVPYKPLTQNHGGSTGFKFGTDLPQAKSPSFFIDRMI
jgi:hypothetical protein